MSKPETWQIQHIMLVCLDPQPKDSVLFFFYRGCVLGLCRNSRLIFRPHVPLRLGTVIIHCCPERPDTVKNRQGMILPASLMLEPK